MDIKIFDNETYESDGSGKLLHDLLAEREELKEGMCLYREPEYRTEGNEMPTYTFFSKEYGVIFFKAFNENMDSLTTMNAKYWEIDGKKEKSGFLKFRNYVHKLTAKISDPILEISKSIKVSTYYIFPYISSAKYDSTNMLWENEKVFFEENYNDMSFEKLESPLSEYDYDKLVSVMQGANIINSFSDAYVDEPAKNMAEAIELNNKKIAKFDYEQMTASHTITDKSERIRGLAGSGKTVLLAMKAARLHQRHPSKTIAFVFYTKSLYSQAIRLIRKYYNQIADSEPDWEKLKVLHSWGGRTVGEGFYSYICKKNNIRPKTLREGTLGDNCGSLLKEESLSEIFDYILIDEAQDFPLEFFLLVEKVAKKPKKIVVAYDELQTTNEVNIPQFNQLFGERDGVPNVELDSKYDYILRKSYRNTLDVLLTAFSFGFGFYCNLTQIIQDKTTWDALGFETKDSFIEGKEITISRPMENSPNSILEFYQKEKPVNYSIFEDMTASVSSVSDEIRRLIYDEKILPTDIMVIDIKTNQTNYLNSIQYKLQELGIDSHIPGIVTDSRDFFIENHVTLTTPRNAKGNEVQYVFVVGCEELYIRISPEKNRQLRNFMLIAITRSKAWVHLSAVGRVKTKFKDEISKVLKNIPFMKYVYPSEEAIRELAKIDFLTTNPKAKGFDADIKKIKKAIDSGEGEILRKLIDLDPTLKQQLMELLNE